MQKPSWYRIYTTKPYLSRLCSGISKRQQESPYLDKCIKLRGVHMRQHSGIAISQVMAVKRLFQHGTALLPTLSTRIQVTALII